MGREEQARSCMCPSSRGTLCCDREPGSTGELDSGREALQSLGDEIRGFPWEAESRYLSQLIVDIQSWFF